MQVRKILLVYPSRAYRGLIRKFIFSEFCDAQITEAGSGSEAADCLRSQSFNIVLVARQPGDMSAADVQRAAAETDVNGQTPFVLLNDDGQGNMVSGCADFSHVVHIRLRPSELIDKINLLCNPRSWRKDARFHLPGVAVTIKSGRLEAEATLINVSKGGLLVDMRTHAPELLMHNDLSLELRGSAGPARIEIVGLTCKLARLNVTRWHPDNTPVAMRASFVFQDIGSAAEDKLDKLLSAARTENAMVDEQQRPDSRE